MMEGTQPTIDSDVLSCQTTMLQLTESISSSKTAMTYCFTNRFDEAQRIIDSFPCAPRLLYNAITESHFACMQALFTFEAELIEIAHTKVNRAAQVCQTYRRQQTYRETMSNWWAGNSAATFEQFTELELHAELCHAECLLAQALLTFIQDEQLIRFVEGALKIRSSYGTYKYCMQAMLNKTSKSVNHKDFSSGVYLGVGTFNVLLSLVPPYVLKLLEWVGFHGDRAEGLRCLDAGLRCDGLRSSMCAIMLLTYHLIAVPSVGAPSSRHDAKYIQKVAENSMAEFPDGSIHLFYWARLKLSQGLLDDAMNTYKRAVTLHTEWQQVRHISFWGMMWCHCYSGEWQLAAECARLLANESRWSKCIYNYLDAVFLLADETKSVEDDDLKEKIDQLMDDVKRHKKIIAGKSLQMEKLAVVRAERYQRTGKLILPALEMIYLWNGFGHMSKSGQMLEHVLSLITSVLDDEKKKDNSPSVNRNDISLCFLLKGSCLRHLKRMKKAEKYLLAVANSFFPPETCQYETYVAPFAAAELGALYADQGEYGKAIEQYKATLTDYSKYGHMSRLHFRLHNRISALKEMENSAVEEGDSGDEFFDANG